MFAKLELFQMASRAAEHASQRHNLIAQNIANADTPGYRMKDLEPFAKAFENSWNSTPGSELKRTRIGHIDLQRSSEVGFHQTQPASEALSPNGNSVSLELEMVKASQAKQAHELAVATYKNGIDLVRASLSTQ